MLIVGCDFHPGWQQIAIFDNETGEVKECKLSHGDGEAALRLRLRAGLD